MRAVIVGCGNIAAVHAAVLSQMEGVSLAACADIREERAEKLAQKYKAHAYTDYEEMLEKEKPDVFHICTPHYLHVPMAVRALGQGIHVFMEKPPVISAEQLETLKLAEAKSNAMLGFCYQNRYNPCVIAAKRLLESGAAGDVLGARAFVTWNRGEKYYTDSGWRGKLATEGGGVLINQSVHTMDLLCDFLGSPDYVEASMQNHHLKGMIEVEDMMEAYIRFQDKTALFYATTAYCADVPPIVEVRCEKMTVRVEDPNLTCIYPDGTVKKMECKPLTPLGKSYWGSGHPACIQEFYDSIGKKQKFPLNLEALEPSIRLMLGMYQSAREGHPAEIRLQGKEKY